MYLNGAHLLTLIISIGFISNKLKGISSPFNEKDNFFLLRPCPHFSWHDEFEYFLHFFLLFVVLVCVLLPTLLSPFSGDDELYYIMYLRNFCSILSFCSFHSCPSVISLIPFLLGWRISLLFKIFVIFAVLVVFAVFVGALLPSLSSPFTWDYEFH